MGTAPDPRPVPTFAQILREIGAATPGGRLATAARVLSGEGDRPATLRLLARLRRSVAPGSDAADLIDRLGRRIRYAGLAGGH
jgi:hypothetical protein